MIYFFVLYRCNCINSCCIRLKFGYNIFFVFFLYIYIKMYVNKEGLSCNEILMFKNKLLSFFINVVKIYN